MIIKNKIVPLILGTLITAGSFYLHSVNMVSLPKATASDSSFNENFKLYYDVNAQRKLLAEIKGLEKLPKFEDFPAIELSSNQNIVVDIDSDPVARLYRGALRSHVKAYGVDFAGKYSLAEWGCGSTCQNGAIVDADTGHVYPLPGLMANGHDSRKDSRLLIQNPIVLGGDWTRLWYKMRYWEWTGNVFKLVGVYKLDLAKKEIVQAAD